MSLTSSVCYPVTESVEWLAKENQNDWRFAVFDETIHRICTFCDKIKPLLYLKHGSGLLCMDCIHSIFFEMNQNPEFVEKMRQELKMKRKELKLKTKEMKTLEKEIKKQVCILQEKTTTTTAAVAAARKDVVLSKLQTKWAHDFSCFHISKTNCVAASFLHRGTCFKCKQEQISTLSIDGKEKFFSFCESCVEEIFKESISLTKKEKKQKVEDLRKKISEIENQIQTLLSEEAASE